MNFKALNGSSSWLAIVGASFFWTWMDRAMFGDSLYFVLADRKGLDLAQAPELAQESFIVMLTASAIVLLALAVAAKRQTSSIWSVKTTLVAAVAGAISTASILLAASANMTALAMAGAFVTGSSMAVLNISWGRICIAQGPAKAMTHIAGAWALGLAINILTEGLVPIAEGTFIIVLPLVSFALYAIDAKLQHTDPYRIDQAEQTPEQTMTAKAHVLGVDVRFPAFILVFCIAFGLMCSFEIFSPAATERQTIIDIVGLRGIVSLLFFIASLTAPARRMESLFNACLSFMVFGLLVMTVGLYTNDVQGLTRIFIPIGYAGFDILVWTLVAFYAKTTATSPLRILAVAMGAEQAGILAGQLIGIALGGSANATNSIMMMALSYLLLIAVMGLARLCTVLWRRQRDDVEASTADSSLDACDKQEDHLDRFADAYELTARERDVFALFAEGRSAPYIAEMLVLSENTVKTHLRHIYTKCNLHNRQELLDAIEAFKR